MRNSSILTAISIFISLVIQAQDYRCLPPPFLVGQHPWADSALAAMSLDEKIGQLFMVAAYSNRDEAHVLEIETLIEEQHIGGLIFMQGGPIRQANLTNRYQALSKTPLLIAMDAEWGLSMRLDSTIKYHREMSLGASRDEQLVYEYGEEMARQLKRMGVHVSFSPVVDINNNIKNPVIGSRSFGESRTLVAQLGAAYMRGLQNNHILANAKHFPGHGDTDVDSHKGLPVIQHPRSRIDSIELYPFRQLIAQGLGSMMIAHLKVPSLDSNTTTLSHEVVTRLLREELAFDGLIFTDALNMNGVASYYEPGEVDLKALLAGNDVLLFPGDVPKAADLIKTALKDGLLSEEELNLHVKRILKAKEWTGASDFTPIKTSNLFKDLNNSKARSVHQKVIEQSMTVLQNNLLLPIEKIDGRSIAVLSITDHKDKALAFEKAVRQHADIDFFIAPRKADFETSKRLSEQLGKYDLVIINFLSTSNSASRTYGITEQAIRLTNDINEQTKVVLNVFANPYVLNSISGVEHMDALVIAYHDDLTTIETCGRMLFGAANANGRLPITINNRYKYGAGKPPQRLTRLRQASPEMIGWKSADLARIDSIANSGIKEQAYPGCRVLVIKDKNIVFDKSYGHLTYEQKSPVTSETVYDLASITKIIASTAAMMRLQDEGKLDVDYWICDYLDLPDSTEHYHIKLKDMLSHVARLKSWIPFYMETLDKGRLKPELYRTRPEPGFTTEVAKDLYIKNAYADTIYKNILDSGLRQNDGYKYSDLGYYYIKSIIEKISGTTLDNYVDSVFYKPMGLSSMGYHPLARMDKDIIAPTEFDMAFRGQLIQG
ncbi:MAG: serine hydrolase, partial [Flavobacteriales bacterium]|nr:serine hydrolase [Flavobacteriales bacterium]